MVGKKVSKKKGRDSNNLVVGIIVILLLIGVFWYFNQSDEVGLSPGMPGNGQGGGGNGGDGKGNGGESDILTSEEREIFDGINKIRNNQNPSLPPLTLNPKLVASAKDWTAKMKKKNKLKHSGSKEYWEIISWGITAADNLKSWKTSEDHLNIIINKSRKEIGVGKEGPFATAHLLPA
jgi:hypothetical protein